MIAKYSRFPGHKKMLSHSSVTAYSPRVAEFARIVEYRPRVAAAVFTATREIARVPMIYPILLLGLAAGALVGLLGIGGGVVLVPALVYLLGMDQHLAQGTSLFVLLPPIGLGALREYWRNGQVDLRSGILCTAGMLVGGYGGSLMAIPISSPHLKEFFGCFMMLAALVLWRNAETPPVAPGKPDHRG
jgi:hypothetical protein